MKGSNSQTLVIPLLIVYHKIKKIQLKMYTSTIELTNIIIGNTIEPKNEQRIQDLL